MILFHLFLTGLQFPFTAPLRRNFKTHSAFVACCLLLTAPAVYSLDQRLKSGVWRSDGHVNEVTQQCQGVHRRLFFHTLILPASFDTTGLLSSELQSVFYSSKLFTQSSWGGLLSGNIYHLLHGGSWNHDVSTVCLFLLKTQTVGWISGRGIVVS